MDENAPGDRDRSGAEGAEGAERAESRGPRRRTLVVAGAIVVGVLLVAAGSAALIGSAAGGLRPGGGDPGTTGTAGAAPTESPETAAGSAGAAGAAGSAPGPVAELGGGGLVDAGWVAGTSASTGVPARAMAAYANASLRVGDEQPGCGVGWNTLAAIGQVESEHGAIHGGMIGDDGRALPRIVGVALDGNGFDAVRDTDGGALDGDTVWDRAVGPMQFLPSTWLAYGADGDGDGVRDPDDIDDAALTAARYLCASGGDLGTAGGWIAAVGSYNSSIDYNNRVAATADEYARLAG